MDDEKDGKYSCFICGETKLPLMAIRSKEPKKYDSYCRSCRNGNSRLYRRQPVVVRVAKIKRSSLSYKKKMSDYEKDRRQCQQANRSAKDIEIGQKVRDARKALGLRAVDLADAIGISATSVKRRETALRRWTKDELKLVSKLLNIEV